MSSFDVDGSKKKKKGTSLLSLDKESRFFAPDTDIISDRAYNMIIGLTIALGFAVNFVMAYFLRTQIMSLPFIGVVIGYFVLAIGGIFIVHKSTSAFVSAIAFFVLAVGTGFLLTFILAEYEISSVYLAFAITAGISVLMTIAATVYPQLFMSMGRGLLVSLLVSFVAEIICFFFFRQALGVFDYVLILIFSGYTGYDWARAQQFQKTVNNAIMSAADLYIDIVNILIRVLEIVGKKSD